MLWGSFQIKIIRARLVSVPGHQMGQIMKNFAPEDTLKSFAKVNRPTQQAVWVLILGLIRMLRHPQRDIKLHSCKDHKYDTSFGLSRDVLGQIEVQMTGNDESDSIEDIIRSKNNRGIKCSLGESLTAHRKWF